MYLFYDNIRKGIYAAVFKVFESGAEYTVKNVEDEVADLLQLSKRDRTMLLPSGREPIFKNDIRWAIHYLKKENLIEKSKQIDNKNYYKITPLGKLIALICHNAKLL